MSRKLQRYLSRHSSCREHLPRESLCRIHLRSLAEVGGENVTATLVSEVDGVQPGSSFTVALKMVHQGGWHTYWENPGTGLPVEIEWDLPEGFSAGPIIWPIPEVKVDEIGTTNIYGGTAYLLTDIKVSSDVDPGESKSLQAKAEWLQCDLKLCARQCRGFGRRLSLE